MRVVSALVCTAIIFASASTPADARKRLGIFGPTKRSYIVPLPTGQARTPYLEGSMEQSRRPVDVSYVGTNGATAFIPPPAPERRSAWEERCKPMLEMGADGLQRYRYAAPDCDLQVLTSR